MSEDFDKEAEREKLRQKYEQDKQKREATEQMSELLLQGATMTNAHCSECSDPIFRYDGQEFCPTCEKPVDRGNGEQAEETDEESIEVTAPSEEGRVAFGEEQNGTAQSEEAAQSTEETAQSIEGTAQSSKEQSETATETNEQSPDRAGRPAQHSPPATQQAPAGNREPPQRGRQAEQATSTATQQATTQEVPSVDPGTASITEAKQSLIRTLTRFSNQAEAADDPRQAKEHLEAAREAAETLSALRR